MTDKKSKIHFYLIDTGSEFYRPLGTRIAICAAAALWVGIELLHRDGFWMVLSAAAFVYCIYVLFLTYVPPAPVLPPRPDETEEETAEVPPDSERKD